jgi:hypothetical protein
MTSSLIPGTSEHYAWPESDREAELGGSGHDTPIINKVADHTG